jgi:glycosyltransferase involved in cell wall biosynthesis
VGRTLRLLFSTPAYAPAASYGGPIQVFERLVEGLTADGHYVEVVTTSLSSLEERGSLRTFNASRDGATIRYLATPVRFRWMGFTPTLPLHLRSSPQPDLVHVFGFRDPLGTAVATWSRLRQIPYVFEGLGMVQPKLRKVRLKRAVDSTILRGVLTGAALLVAASERERDEYVSAAGAAARIAIRPNGFPEPVQAPSRGTLRRRIGLEADTPLVVSVGRIARGKGLELLVQAVAELPGVHAAIVGADGGHGMTGELDRLRRRLGVEQRIHLPGPVPHDELPPIYADADVFALPSAHENFGLVAAEAAAVGAAIVVSNRCGVAELLRNRGGVVISYDRDALREALRSLLADPDRRRALGEGARRVAAEWTWQRVVRMQEELYERALAGA